MGKVLMLFMASALFNSCSVHKTPFSKPFGGNFNLNTHNRAEISNSINHSEYNLQLSAKTTIQISENAPEITSLENAASKSPVNDSNFISDDSLYQVLKKNNDFVFKVHRKWGGYVLIDKLPGEINQYTNADRHLFKAKKLLIALNNPATKWYLFPLYYIGASTPVIGLTVFLAYTFNSINTQIQNQWPLLLSLIFNAVITIMLWTLIILMSTVWLIFFIISFFIRAYLLSRAINKIEKSAKKAPDNRRIEYEVRVLEMLSYYYDKYWLKYRIRRVRDMMPKYTFDEIWSERLNELEKRLQK